jgi:prevent-host-death family protein
MLVYVLYMARNHVSVAALRTRLAGVLRDVERGSEVLVTRSGRPVAKLVPAVDVDTQLRAAGLQPPQRPGPVPRVKPVRLSHGASLTRTVLEARE